ncbi:pancreatic progenitor cell differentiation and proliferation factor-like protein isoform X2 [Chiroxiphia lanceolata]|uniref:pancreatic progenitor cell differentiation and proliferation factor-like protein isoform X2 n=1 Tax=Chiroxiphia lanceolata TaxID=296741 RepID=UPI0013CE616F|nr:pancreatic progenitor cell differentiation and proliferation factor-like protein isoform X2 [Chiroxiphia lanceolata]
MKMRITKAAALSPRLWHSREVLRDDGQEERQRGSGRGRGALRGPTVPGRPEQGLGDSSQGLSLSFFSSFSSSLSPSFLPSLSSVPPHRPLGGPPAAAHIGAAPVAGGTAHPSTRGLLSEKRRIPNCAAAMASVPSAGCLLAKNQYYRRLPDLIDKYWWIKSFFHSEPSPPPLGRKTLSASSTNS